MKIIFLCDSLIKGGRERRMIELIKGLLNEPNVHIELILFKNLIEYLFRLKKQLKFKLG